MAYTAIDAQGHSPISVKSKQGVPQQLQRRLIKEGNLRIGSWNVGAMTGKGRGIVDVMERRK